MPEQVLAWVEAGATVVTANRRLARSLLGKHERACIDAGLVVWNSADVLPWNAWLTRCWSELRESSTVPVPALLGPEQELLVWRTVIAGAAPGLLRVEAAAQAAREAWHHLHEWCLTPGDLHEPLAADPREFVRWCRGYVGIMERRGWVDRPCALLRLIKLATEASGESPAPGPETKAGRASGLPPGVALAKSSSAVRSIASWMDHTDQTGVTTACGGKAICFAGFDEFSPARTRLLDALTRLGVSVCRSPAAAEGGEGLENTHGTQRPVCVQYPDPETEFLAAAHWARAVVAAADGEGRVARVAIVVPDLQARRSTLARLAEQVFAPARRRADPGPEPPRFELSLGEPLIGRALVADALHVLDLVTHRLSLAAVGALLRSRYLGLARIDPDHRARLEVRLRATGRRWLTLANLLAVATDLDGRTAQDLQCSTDQSTAQSSDQCPGQPARSASTPLPQVARSLTGWLRRLEEARPRFVAQATGRYWAQQLEASLHQAGWPGPGGLDSEEFQEVEAFRDVLAAFPGNQVLEQATNARTAVASLRGHLKERVFQAQAATSGDPGGGLGATPVSIMGVLESAGLEFDAIWVCGMDDQSWPPPPRPNPFLPIALQRRAGMPRADRVRERAVAAAITARLARAARAVVFSHALAVDGEGRQVSALVHPFLDSTEAVPHSTAAVLPVGCNPENFGAQAQAQQAQAQHCFRFGTAWDGIRRARPDLDRALDAVGPVLATGRKVGGGARMFVDQSACPFRAFAAHRLFATSVRSVTGPLNAQQHGRLMHAALDRLWTEIGSRTVLEGLSRSARSRCIAMAVDAALDRSPGLGESPADQMPAGLVAMERRRLRHLLERWLELELSRTDFAVEALERDRTASVAGVTVSLRPDRLDRLSDGTLVLLDYKSGRQSIGAWHGERPDDPQLLVYATALAEDHEQVAAISYAVLSSDQFGFRGLARDSGFAPGLRKSPATPDSPQGDSPSATAWKLTLEGWKRAVAALGQGIATGDARIDPKAGPKTCQGCEQRGFCRVDWRRRSGYRAA